LEEHKKLTDKNQEIINSMTVMQKQIQNETTINPLEDNSMPDNKVVLSLGDTKEKKCKKRKGTKK
jgi:hypothetical protein